LGDSAFFPAGSLRVDLSGMFDRKSIYANPSSYPNFNSNTNPNPNPNPRAQ